jgi:hypothetical protein
MLACHPAQVSWNASAAASALRVELSTDKGRTWCAVTSDGVFSDELHGGAANTPCLFPAGAP